MFAGLKTDRHWDRQRLKKNRFLGDDKPATQNDQKVMKIISRGEDLLLSHLGGQRKGPWSHESVIWFLPISCLE